MSAGRFEWEATRFEHMCDDTGARLVVREVDGDTWHWKIEGVGIPFSDGSGAAGSASAAKGAARKVLDAFKTKRVTP